MTEPVGKFTFELELGVLLRSTVVWQIRKSAASYGVRCEVIENRGLLSSDYHFTVSGDRERVETFRGALRSYLAQIGES